jgi:hypothetical protein
MSVFLDCDRINKRQRLFKKTHKNVRSNYNLFLLVQNRATPFLTISFISEGFYRVQNVIKLSKWHVCGIAKLLAWVES